MYVSRMETVTVAWSLWLCFLYPPEAELPPCPMISANTLLSLPGTAYKLVCYFTNWAHSRPGPASIMPRDLNPFLCTHLIFAFASMNNNQIVAKNVQDEKILYPEFNRLKERYARVLDFRAREKFSPFLLLTLSFPGLPNPAFLSSGDLSTN